jgi:hypothetical protein
LREHLIISNITIIDNSGNLNFEASYSEICISQFLLFSGKVSESFGLGGKELKFYARNLGFECSLILNEFSIMEQTSLLGYLGTAPF